MSPRDRFKRQDPCRPHKRWDLVPKQRGLSRQVKQTVNEHLPYARTVRGEAGNGAGLCFYVFLRLMSASVGRGTPAPTPRAQDRATPRCRDVGAVCKHPPSAPRVGARSGEREEHVAGWSSQAPCAGPSVSGVGLGCGRWRTERILQKQTNVFWAKSLAGAVIPM